MSALAAFDAAKVAVPDRARYGIDGPRRDPDQTGAEAASQLDKEFEQPAPSEIANHKHPDVVEHGVHG